MVLKKIILVLIFLQVFYNCVSINPLQDGRTLKKNSIEIAPSINFSSTNNVMENCIKTCNEHKIIPYITIRGKYGIRHNLDLGVNVDFSTNLGFTGKYQFIGNQTAKINASVGLDFGLNIYLIAYEKIQYYYSVPFYLSYNPNDKFAFYLTPRFINNSKYIYDNKYTKDTIGYDYQYNRLSISYGVLYGKKNKYGIEISNNSRGNIIRPTHLSIGYVITF